MPREWILPPDSEIPAALLEAVGGNPLVARLLSQRGLTDPANVRGYLDPRHYVLYPAEALAGVAETVLFLRRAIERGERIRIWGDFDADGQTATVVLYEALSALGARVDYALPHRDEGHGLHLRVVEDAAREGVTTLITCDTGINENEVIAQGVALGLTVLITDHHDLPETLPPAQAIVDPKMLSADHPLYELTGVGVAYIVARALLESTVHASVLDEMLDIVALGLVADVATQVKDVRYLIQRGLTALRQTRRPGLRAMVQAAGLELAYVDEVDISFKLGPRLNAAGRLADSEMAVRLLHTRNELEARRLAEELEALNRDRQGLTDAVLAAAEEQLAHDPALANQAALILEGEDWEPGVLGLVAGTLARRYDRPAILIAHRDGQPSIASARSVHGIDVHQAIASRRDDLIREGGHPMAAGFSLERERVADFRRGLLHWLEHEAPPRGGPAPLQIDAAVAWGEINLTLLRELARLGPFGAGNPRPTLMTGAGTLVHIEPISRRPDMPHRRLCMTDDSGRRLCFAWFNPLDLPTPGQRIEIAFYPSIGHWRGEDRVQLEVIDWRPAPSLSEPAAPAPGRTVIDRRSHSNGEALLDELRATLGNDLVVWAEHPGGKIEGALTRHELVGRRARTLAVLTAPPDGPTLYAVLDQVQPQTVYLLPPHPVSEFSPTELLSPVEEIRQEAAVRVADDFASHLARMLQYALNEYEGWIDVRRMAAHLGARQAAIVLALQRLEAEGRIILRHEGQGWRAYRPGAGEPGGMLENGRRFETDEERRRRLEQMRNALAMILYETAVYRRAYSQGAPVLLHGLQAGQQRA